jgi:hypothetical protein
MHRVPVLATDPTKELIRMRMADTENRRWRVEMADRLEDGERFVSNLGRLLGCRYLNLAGRRGWVDDDFYFEFANTNLTRAGATALCAKDSIRHRVA